ncbi:MAG: zinc ribbon domain-containing protein [Clostridiales bacterium]|nr:zinc ribbon domain-containing protein [Clostridiales bacterium]
MSYNSNYRNNDYRNNNGVIYPFAVITAVLLLVANLFYLRGIIYSLNYLDDWSEYGFLSFIVNMLSLAELALILALTISVFARASNHAIGNIQIATAIVTGIELTFRFISFRGALTISFWFGYAFLLAYQISMAVVIKLRKEAIKYTWFIPGIMACLSIGYAILFNLDSFRYAFSDLRHIHSILDLSYFMTAFLEPVVTVAFAFCVMAWASHRIQDKKGASKEKASQPNTPANTPAVAVAPVAAQPVPAQLPTAANTRICPKCGASLLPGARFCSSCGADVQVGFCQNCGASVNPGDVFCEKCGARVQ